MKQKVTLNDSEINILDKLAKRSKMDCWFLIDDKGRVRNLENYSRIMSTKKAVRQLTDGLTQYDIEGLTSNEVVTLLNLLLRL